ncbi:adenylosuccinate synthase [Paracrocinitomix mangrovi]|uniref:adenylosuccinate synthase n=1 Tax=Paracrocinitomix mangrovi TaxID=2862509 RepID=UPI001C8E7441|nr:adenylosuccinate synthase [Paracrocinitomix mangrovi]UKN03010.1 adenylosuccinate synthase [Paracrocinitomix mangrovi]
MKVDVLLGLQWGDEGKGKIVDVVTPDYNIIARFQGGPNAGHTLIFEGQKQVLHTIPSGIFRKNTVNVIGNGVVIDPITLKAEIEAIEAKGVDVASNLMISRKAHLILPTHKILDKYSEESKGKKKIGSTLKGIGPTYMDKTGRNGLRMGDTESPNFKAKYNALVEKHQNILGDYDYQNILNEFESVWFEALEFLKKIPLIDSEHYINQAIKDGKKVLAEGAQGTMLDIDFGTYPFVTSSNTITAGTCTGLGVAPNRIGDVIGIFKAYCTRVGSGPFPTELDNEIGEEIRKIGHEYGATTGRDRRCGWIDLPALKYACMVNGATKLAMMKADVLDKFETIQVCTHYEINGEKVDYFPYDITDLEITPVYKEVKGWNKDLTQLQDLKDAPQEFLDYIAYLESELHVPISIVSVGPDRAQTIIRS